MQFPCNCFHISFDSKENHFLHSWFYNNIDDSFTNCFPNNNFCHFLSLKGSFALSRGCLIQKEFQMLECQIKHNWEKNPLTLSKNRKYRERERKKFFAGPLHKNTEMYYDVQHAGPADNHSKTPSTHWEVTDAFTVLFF